MRALRIPTPDVLALIQLYFVLAALAFFILATLDHYPMKPEIYGQAVYFLPAEAWSGYLLAVHGLSAVGLWMDRARMVVAGCAGAVLAYVAFAVLARPAEFGDLVVIFSAFVNAPIQLTIGLRALSEAAHDGRTG